MSGITTGSAAVEETAEQATRSATWLEEAVEANQNQILEVDANDENELLILAERNSRPIPPIGDKSIKSLAEAIGRSRQLMPGLAVLNGQGVAELYAGFRRARAVQTWNKMKGYKPGDANYRLYRVLITPEVLNDTDALVDSLAENVFREDMGLLEKVEALKRLMGEPHNLNLKSAAEKMNMSHGGASTHLRFDLFPANAKRAMATGKLGYASAERLVKFLPDRVVLAADEDGSKLAKAQERIGKLVERELASAGKVGSSAVDHATRNMEADGGEGDGEGGSAKRVNERQRKVKGIIQEIDAYLAELPEDREEQQWAEVALAAFKKFVNGGSMKALTKTLNGE